MTSQKLRLLWLTSCLIIEIAFSGECRVYRTPGLTDAQRSPFYEVTVNSQPTDVYISRPPVGDDRFNGRAFDLAEKRSFSYTTFSFAEQVEVTVKKKSGTFKDVLLRPSSQLGKAFNIIEKNPNAGTVRIQITKPNAKVSVEFIDDDWNAQRQLPRNAMLLFADRLESQDTFAPPSKTGNNICIVKPGKPMNPTEDTDTVTFEAGLHALGYWEVPKQIKRIHLEGGAYVLGAINAQRTNGCKFTGRGVISGEKFVWRALKKDPDTFAPRGSRFYAVCVKLLETGGDYHIEGPTLVNSPHFVCNTDGQGTVRNLKILGSWQWNNDGLDVSNDSLVTECFISAFDDAFKLYHSNGRVTDCVVWQMNNGAVFQLGWGGKSPHDVIVENIDVIHTEFTGTNENWGLIALAQHNGRGTIRNYSFNNIRMEGPVARIIGLHLHESPRQAIDGMMISNLSVGRVLAPSEYPFKTESGVESFGIVSDDVNIVGGNIKGLTFTNLTIDGVKITDKNCKDEGYFNIVGTPDLTFK